ncbi:MAG TPA: 3-oxoacyl-ACP reductase family protein [Syntrophales bacterium]|nr:3-oxoacyl-ACP reductase family protein [Syntrophales bacterium]
MEGKRTNALVTGGSRGIGRAVARELARRGHFVWINYLRNEAAAAETLRILREEGGDGALAPFDVADYNLTQAAVGKLIEARGSVGILVNNAGRSRDGLIARAGEADWEETIGPNLKGVFNCCRAVVRDMMKNRWGRIVNMTSVVAESGNPGQSLYGASKAGVAGFTRSLARELGPRNITVNAVSPGFIATEMTASLPRAAVEKIIDMIPLGRPGTPEDVAAAVAFLTTGEADYITGQVIHVNGGLYM